MCYRQDDGPIRKTNILHIPSYFVRHTFLLGSFIMRLLSNEIYFWRYLKVPIEVMIFFFCRSKHYWRTSALETLEGSVHFRWGEHTLFCMLLSVHMRHWSNCGVQGQRIWSNLASTFRYQTVMYLNWTYWCQTVLWSHRIFYFWFVDSFFSAVCSCHITDIFFNTSHHFSFLWMSYLTMQWTHVYTDAAVPRAMSHSS